MPEERPGFSLAEALFMKASTSYSASAVAQGAFIALECRKSGIDPEELGNSIINNPERIDRMCRVAEKAHSDLTEDRKPKIVRKRVEDIILADFKYAKIFKALHEDELRYIFKLYKDLKEEAKTFDREHMMIDKVKELLR